jgi:hypothetical protein
MNPLTIAAVEIIHAQHAADLDASNRKQEWLERITAPQEIDGLLTPADHDEIDEIDEIDAPWPEFNPPSQRKDSEVNRVLSILDKLPTGKDEA